MAGSPNVIARLQHLLGDKLGGIHQYFIEPQNQEAGGEREKRVDCRLESQTRVSAEPASKARCPRGQTHQRRS
jgi:hypothetical protein